MGRTKVVATRPSRSPGNFAPLPGLGGDTIVVFDTHWLVNSATTSTMRHVSRVYTSNELPHFIRNMPYAYDGNPELGQVIADAATAAGVRTRAHSDTSLTLEYGTLVPMRYMNETGISRWCRCPPCARYMSARQRHPRCGTAAGGGGELRRKVAVFASAPCPTASPRTVWPTHTCIGLVTFS